MNEVQCFISCISESGLTLPFITLVGLTSICLILFFIKRKFGLLVGGQIFATILISFNLFSMQCYMFKWIWIYLGIILIGTLLISIAKYYFALHLSNMIIQPSSFIFKLEQEFKAPIDLIDTQKIKAFHYKKRIYLSVGLLERLEKDEIRAVVAHEVYHLNHSPNKLISSFLALTSLTFCRYNDEHHADCYAAKTTGIQNLINALRKLEIKDYEERARRLSPAYLLLQIH